MESKSFSMTVRVTPTDREFEIKVLRPPAFHQLKEICIEGLGEQVDVKLVYLGRILKHTDDLGRILKPDGLIILFKQYKRPDENGPQASSFSQSNSYKQGPPNFEGMGFPGYGGIYGIGKMRASENMGQNDDLNDFLIKNPQAIQFAIGIMSNPQIMSKLSETQDFKQLL